MADYTVSAQFDLIAHQEHTHSTTAKAITGTARTSTDMLGVLIHMHHGFVEAGANTNPGSFYVQTRLSTGDDEWVNVAQFTTTDATTVSEAMTATEPVGEVTLACASTTGFANGDLIYVQDTTTATDSEWHQVDHIVTNTSIDILEDGLVVQKDSSDVIFSDAEHFSMYLDLAGVADYRVVYLHNGAVGMNTAVWVTGIEVTDIE